MAQRLGAQETQKAIANMTRTGLDEQTAHDMYSAVSELVRGSVLLARLAQRHNAAQAAEPPDGGRITSVQVPPNDQAFELLLTSVLGDVTHRVNGMSSIANHPVTNILHSYRTRLRRPHPRIRAAECGHIVRQR